MKSEHTTVESPAMTRTSPVIVSVLTIVLASLCLGLTGCASEDATTDPSGRPLPPDSRETQLRDVNYQIEAGQRGSGGIYR